MYCVPIHYVSYLNAIFVGMYMYCFGMYINILHVLTTLELLSCTVELLFSFKAPQLYILETQIPERCPF